MVRFKRALFLFVVILMPGSVMLAQSPEPVVTNPVNPVEGLIHASFLFDNTTPLIGEPVRVTLRVEAPEEIQIVEWPEFSDYWGPFMIVDAGDVVGTTREGAMQVFSQILTVLVWEPGDYETPSTFIGYKPLDSLDESIYRIPFRDAFISAPSVLDNTDLNALVLKPSRRPFQVFYFPLWAAATILVLIGAFVGSGWRWWGRRKSAAHARGELAKQPTPQGIAMDALRQLQRSGSSPVEVSVGVVDVFRNFLWHMYEIPAQDMTTQDLHAAIEDDARFDEGDIRFIGGVFTRGDLIKYANTTPDVAEAESLLRDTYQWIRNTMVNHAETTEAGHI